MGAGITGLVALRFFPVFCPLRRGPGFPESPSCQGRLPFTSTNKASSLKGPGLISHRNEGTLPRLAVAPQPLLDMCENEGVVLTARPDQGPLVTFAHDYSLEDKLRKLCYLGACFDGLLLTMRSMEYLSKSKKFDRMEALSRADVVIGSNGTTGVMFIKRHKGDKKQQWPAKQFSPAFRGKLCALALRLVYERLNPVPWNIDPSTVPYWQLPDTLPLTRTNLQSFLQAHMTRMGAPAKLYKSHSLRKGGVTALLAAGVPLHTSNSVDGALGFP